MVNLTAATVVSAASTLTIATINLQDMANLVVDIRRELSAVAMVAMVAPATVADPSVDTVATVPPAATVAMVDPAATVATVDPAASAVATVAPAVATVAPAATAVAMVATAATADPTVDMVAPASEAPAEAMADMAAATDGEEPNTTFRPVVHEKVINLMV